MQFQSSIHLDFGKLGQFFCSEYDRTLINHAICRLPDHRKSRKFINTALYLANCCGLILALKTQREFFCSYDSGVINGILEALKQNGLSKVRYWSAFPQQNSDRSRIYLFCYDSHFDPVCFLKIGLDPVSKNKIRRETSTLNILSKRFNSKYINASIKIPKILGIYSNASIQLLILEMLPVNQGLHRNRLLDKREVIENLRVRLNRKPVDEVMLSDWCHELFYNTANEQQVFLAAIKNKCQQHLDLCSVHGDLTEANIIRIKNQLYVIDWEDYSSDAPILVDEINYDLQSYSKLKTDKAIVKEFMRDKLTNVSDKRYFEILMALAFLAWSGREIATTIIENWPEL